MKIFVKGRQACFTRPECKAERMSYPCITPSAARALFRSILWKPAFRWEIQSILICSPIVFAHIKRNEIISSKISVRRDATPISSEENRCPRHMTYLKDVAYLIEADILLTEKGIKDNEAKEKFVSMFTRRLNKGQQYFSPYLGCREFVADIEPETGNEKAIDDTFEIPSMLYDLRYPEDEGKKGKPEPFFFNAHVEKGFLKIPTRKFVFGG